MALAAPPQGGKGQPLGLHPLCSKVACQCLPDNPGRRTIAPPALQLEQVSQVFRDHDSGAFHMSIIAYPTPAGQVRPSGATCAPTGNVRTTSGPGVCRTMALKFHHKELRAL